jgi:hypothetical protein
MSQGGEEVLHLPVIVEAAESSPVAAAAAAQQIRKFLTREWSQKPYVQYNAIMLIRILSDHPGPNFTRNFDKQFVSTIKELLRNCKDGSTQQILRETLDTLEVNKSLQEGLELLITMWRKEKGQQARLSQGPQQYHQQQQPYTYGTHHPDRPRQQHRSSSNRQLPAPHELASRIEEARNTAKILLQLIQSTPSEDVVNNDLLREFAERCQTAQRSMQGYINCNTPPPDDDTMLTLIETNEQLSLAASRYQRALLSARKALGLSPSPSQQLGGGNVPSDNAFKPLPGPPTEPQSLFDSSQPVYQTYQQPAQPPSQSAFSAPPNRDESFQPPPGPPPAMLARLNSRDGQQSPPHSPSTQYNAPPGPPPHRSPPAQHASDPFADPVEHERNAAPVVAMQQSYDQHPARRPHSQTFSIDAEPSYPSNAPPSRPALGAYHNSGITPSYLGRQSEAVQGATMHGAQPVSEIDGHSEVGRTAADNDDHYGVSPVEQRQRGMFGSR